MLFGENLASKLMPLAPCKVILYFIQILKPAQADRRKFPLGGGGNQRPNTPPRGGNNKKGKK